MEDKQYIGKERGFLGILEREKREQFGAKFPGFYR